ncbi:hypothetical protein [Streptomyces boncukensis]|uniref:Uncharacterized protein n=1 Tax=Streptomyces boncukensis TaxID=2711219 RepID=A0A6G4WVM3_9ACTN|nr:hypothetical protein [Streptomyces boncukensis]NGO68521.1 hypothetical protein [Streptomyces boncukensis]
MSSISTASEARALLKLQGLRTPSRQGYQAWSTNPDSCSTVLTLSAGRLYLEALAVDEDFHPTAIDYYVSSTASSPTADQCLVGLYGPSGTLLASETTLFDSTGVVSLDLSAVGELAEGLYRVAFLFNGSTGPQIPRASQSAGGPGLTNIGLSVGDYRAAYNGSSNTSLPDPIDFTANTAYIPLFCAIR